MREAEVTDRTQDLPERRGGRRGVLMKCEGCGKGQRMVVLLMSQRCEKRCT